MSISSIGGDVPVCPDNSPGGWKAIDESLVGGSFDTEDSSNLSRKWRDTVDLGDDRGNPTMLSYHYIIGDVGVDGGSFLNVTAARIACRARSASASLAA